MTPDEFVKEMFAEQDAAMLSHISKLNALLRDIAPKIKSLDKEKLKIELETLDAICASLIRIRQIIVDGEGWTVSPETVLTLASGLCALMERLGLMTFSTATHNKILSIVRSYKSEDSFRADLEPKPVTNTSWASRPLKTKN